jgi:putative transposase
MDFFTVPATTSLVLYCFFVISHGRRNVLHLNVTEHPTGSWIVQQLREAFPEDRAFQHLILDRDPKVSVGCVMQTPSRRICCHSAANN